MSVYTEQATEDHSNGVSEVLWEGNTYFTVEKYGVCSSGEK